MIGVLVKLDVKISFTDVNGEIKEGIFTQTVELPKDGFAKKFCVPVACDFFLKFTQKMVHAYISQEREWVNGCKTIIRGVVIEKGDHLELFRNGWRSETPGYEDVLRMELMSSGDENNQ